MGVREKLRRMRILLKKCLWRMDHPPPQRTTTDLAEVMKYEKLRRGYERSVASHANSNAVTSNVGVSQQMQKTTQDALASLARGLQGRM